MNFPTFNLILTVFLFWLTIQIGASHEEYLSYFFILTVGIIHGSNDISLIKVLTRNTGSLKKYLLLYVGVILATIVAFVSFPSLALFFFIIVSCYHFGEQHFHNQVQSQNTFSRLLFFGYGVLIFGLLFYFNSENTSIIINELIGYTLNENYFLWFMIAGAILTLVFSIYNIKNFKSSFNYFQELFLILLFAILFKMAALLWAFAIYFIVWHSIPSLVDQIGALYGKSNKLNVIQYIKSSFVYWLISIAGLYILYYTTTYFEIQFVTIFFAFLAAITIPHVVVMYFLNKN
ncbi:Brp/Blh family beta-carotene 15,15'-dioxygenase [Winogradskyella flava]|uniref:Brp/Blh family beta-carotene 15,15'-dioxygenase n=1 Tax=Winogradskyella flava TaxID=1884876 RepID=UPI002491E02F|nr:Brp/Blh family beta-carotene 15,15'-dioxygenase [Winogradskyella flava]